MTDEDKDPALEHAWRAHSRETPPPALDQQILAAAHRAVSSGPQKFGAEAMRPPRWWMPIAAAAVIGVVAIGVVQLAPNEPVLDMRPSVSAPQKNKEADQSAPMANAPASVSTPKAVTDAPAPAQTPPAMAAAKPQVATPPQAPRAAMTENKLAVTPAPEPFPAAPAPQKTEAQRDMQKRDAMSVESSPQPAAAAPAPAPMAADELRKDARRERQAPAAAAAGALSQQPARNIAPAEDARKQALDPDAWIVRIRKLKDEGQVAEAQRELKSFRELVPDAERRLPQDLREWKP